MLQVALSGGPHPGTNSLSAVPLRRYFFGPVQMRVRGPGLCRLPQRPSILLQIDHWGGVDRVTGLLKNNVEKQYCALLRVSISRFGQQNTYTLRRQCTLQIWPRSLKHSNLVENVNSNLLDRRSTSVNISLANGLSRKWLPVSPFIPLRVIQVKWLDNKNKKKKTQRVIYSVYDTTK